MYSYTLPLTSALDRVGGQRHAPAALPPGKIRYSLYRRLGKPQGRSGQVRKISPPTGIRSPDRPARSKSLYRLRYRGPVAPASKLKPETIYTDMFKVDFLSISIQILGEVTIVSSKIFPVHNRAIIRCYKTHDI
jgi:hypothetical protein